MEALWPLALWLGISTVYLVDALILVIMLGPYARPAVRQLGLAAPLLFTFLTLLFTPWGSWAAAFLLAALALHLTAHLAGVRRVANGLVEAPPEMVQRVGELAGRFGAPEPDLVLLDPADRIDPGVMGLRRQALILPRAALALPAAEFEAIIAHELAHVAARDPLKLWLIGFARTLMGWHPAARKLAEGILIEMEMEADRKATAWLGDAESYALTLGRWGLRHATGRPSPFGVALTGTSSQLMLRLKSLLNPSAPPPHLEIPEWIPGGAKARQRREAGDQPARPPSEAKVRLIHLGLSAGYLALFLLLIRLV